MDWVLPPVIGYHSNTPVAKLSSFQRHLISATKGRAGDRLPVESKLQPEFMAVTKKREIDFYQR